MTEIKPDPWTADGQTLYRDGIAVGTLDTAGLASWVAEACETLAEMDQAQAEWEASGESPRCAVVNIGGEEIRIQGGADMPEPLHNAVSEVIGAARRAMAEAKAAERAEIEREVRAMVSAEILAERASLPATTIDEQIFQTGMVLAARVATVGPTRAPRSTGDAHNPGREHGEGSGGYEASQGRSGASLDWHYGPTDTDPDPGKMWHYDCGQEVMYLEGGHICRCGAQDQEETR